MTFDDTGRVSPEAGSPPDTSEAAPLFPTLYDELRGMAAARLRHERPGHTFRPTDLVHEAYLKLAGQKHAQLRGRTHALAVASTAMRRILMDHARGRARVKRGGALRQVTLHEDLQALSGGPLSAEALIELDEALRELKDADPRQARVVELRIFGGLNMAEVAEALAVSKRTVEGDWTHALAWLRRRLAGDHAQ